MSTTLALGGRALREVRRTPEALFPSLFIPLFFLVVDVGQAGKVFPSSSAASLEGQGYAAFQLPSSLLLAGSFGAAAMFLVEDLEGGYFDKLRATPASRTSIVLGRLLAEGVKGVVLTSVLLLVALPSGVGVASGPVGVVLLVVLAAGWAVVCAGALQLLALRTRRAAATQSGGLVSFPLLFLTPNSVPRELLTRPMEVAATCNPVTHVMEALRSLVLQDLDRASLAPGSALVLAVLVAVVALDVRVIRSYD